jgi:hypothetical protein
MNNRIAPLERFWKFVEPCPATGCWLWIGGIGGDGYPRFGWGGNNQIGAHRAAWKLFRGEIPEGNSVLHHCDVPSCVNPSHLFVGTTRDNVLDMFKKGRARIYRGCSNSRAKLTPEQLLLIRSDKRSVKELSEELGIKAHTIYQARVGRRYGVVE